MGRSWCPIPTLAHGITCIIFLKLYSANERRLTNCERDLLVAYTNTQNIPPVVVVKEVKKAKREEMGRKITLAPNCYVEVGTSKQEVGRITSMFVYSSICYVVLQKLTKPTNIYGMLHYTCTDGSSILALSPLSLLGRPLPLALDNSDLWVLNI